MRGAEAARNALGYKSDHKVWCPLPWKEQGAQAQGAMVSAAERLMQGVGGDYPYAVLRNNLADLLKSRIRFIKQGNKGKGAHAPQAAVLEPPSRVAPTRLADARSLLQAARPTTRTLTQHHQRGT